MSHRVGITFLQPGDWIRVQRITLPDGRRDWAPCRSGVRRNVVTATVVQNRKGEPFQRRVVLRLPDGTEEVTQLSALGKIERLDEED